MSKPSNLISFSHLQKFTIWLWLLSVLASRLSGFYNNGLSASALWSTVQFSIYIYMDEHMILKAPLVPTIKHIMYTNEFLSWMSNFL